MKKLKLWKKVNLNNCSYKKRLIDKFDIKLKCKFILLAKLISIKY